MPAEARAPDAAMAVGDTGDPVQAEEETVMAAMRAHALFLALAAPSAIALPLFGDGFEPPGMPRAGAIVFTEVLSNPVLVADNVGEWFELANVGGRRVQLQGCELQGNSGASPIAAGLLLPPGGLAVFARSSDPLANGNVPADATFAFALLSNDLLSLSCSGELIDAIEWSSETPGRSRSLDASAWDATANDLDANWCLSVASYNGTDTGTPGSPLHACGNGGPVLPPPGPGELWIGELMSDPAGELIDANAEWIELQSLAPEPVGLDDCVLGNGGGGSVGLQGLQVAPGGRLLLARSESPELNGGLTPDRTFSFTLTNGGGTLILACGDSTIDQVAYSASTPGRSFVRADSLLVCVAPAGTPEYFAGNSGTPGQPNVPACPP
jgi:hypothetical protein